MHELEYWENSLDTKSSTDPEQSQAKFQVCVFARKWKEYPQICCN